MYGSNSIRRMRDAAKAKTQTWTDDLYIPNCIGSQLFIGRLGQPQEDKTAWSGEGGVTISAKVKANKPGLPDGSETYRYTFAGPGWTVTVDAVWVDGRLFKKATHTRVKLVRPNTAEARQAFNAWLTDGA